MLSLIGMWPGLVFWFTTALFAQQTQTPADPVGPVTRAATIERARDKKEATLKPEEVSPTERALRDIRDQKWVERLTGGYNGVRAKLGNMVTGGGFAVGPEYFREDLADGRVTLRMSAQASTRRYSKLEAEGTLRRLWRRRLTFSALASRRDYASLNYYGPGPDSRQDLRSNYRLEDTLVEVFGVVKPWRWATVGASIGKLWINVGPGTDSRFVSTDRLYTESQLPGIQQQTDYVRSSVFGQLDYRDDPNGPKAGGNYIFQYSWYSDRVAGAYGFRRTDLDFQQFIPFLNKTRRFALRAKATFTESDGSQRTPFYLQPILGGSDDLRGFRPFRFSDRNMMVYNAEYQWEIFSGLEGAVFGDAGKVMPRRGQLNFSDLETSLGVGLRFNARNRTFLRFDVGFSHEGFQVWLKFNDVFNSRRFGTAVGQPVY
jgi:hypothetical protein